MEIVQIIDEINRLPLTEKIRVVEIVLRNIRRETEKTPNLAEGANALKFDYENDAELTAFTALDAESFYEAK